MKKYLQILLSALAAGMWIGIGGTVYLSLKAMNHPIAGAVLFSIGLLMIVTCSFHLYTGKIGYLFKNKPCYLWELLFTWIGNLGGTALVGYLLRLTRLSILPIAREMCEVKLSDSRCSIFILSVFCGILMYAAVNGYFTSKEPFGRFLVVIFPVTVFILSGFEHCVANMFYFSAANMWSWKAWEYLFFMTLGNSLGGVLLSFFPFTKSDEKISFEEN